MFSLVGIGEIDDVVLAVGTVYFHKNIDRCDRVARTQPAGRHIRRNHDRTGSRRHAGGRRGGHRASVHRRTVPDSVSDVSVEINLGDRIGRRQGPVIRDGVPDDRRQRSAAGSIGNARKADCFRRESVASCSVLNIAGANSCATRRESCFGSARLQIQI